jgi:hypothetical protein
MSHIGLSLLSSLPSTWPVALISMVCDYLTSLSRLYILLEDLRDVPPEQLAYTGRGSQVYYIASLTVSDSQPIAMDASWTIEPLPIPIAGGDYIKFATLTHWHQQQHSTQSTTQTKKSTTPTKGAAAVAASAVVPTKSMTAPKHSAASGNSKAGGTGTGDGTAKKTMISPLSVTTVPCDSPSHRHYGHEGRIVMHVGQSLREEDRLLVYDIHTHAWSPRLLCPILNDVEPTVNTVQDSYHIYIHGYDFINDLNRWQHQTLSKFLRYDVRDDTWITSSLADARESKRSQLPVSTVKAPLSSVSSDKKSTASADHERTITSLPVPAGNPNSYDHPEDGYECYQGWHSIRLNDWIYYFGGAAGVRIYDISANVWYNGSHDASQAWTVAQFQPAEYVNKASRNSYNPILPKWMRAWYPSITPSVHSVKKNDTNRSNNGMSGNPRTAHSNDKAGMMVQMDTTGPGFRVHVWDPSGEYTGVRHSWTELFWSPPPHLRATWAYAHGGITPYGVRQTCPNEGALTIVGDNVIALGGTFHHYNEDKELASAYRRVWARCLSLPAAPVLTSVSPTPSSSSSTASGGHANVPAGVTAGVSAGWIDPFNLATEPKGIDNDCEWWSLPSLPAGYRLARLLGSFPLSSV